ncbi:MAG: hypothetical protein ACJ77M_09210 [Thermoleophilaceae bacterium]
MERVVVGQPLRELLQRLELELREAAFLGGERSQRQQRLGAAAQAVDVGRV